MQRYYFDVCDHDEIIDNVGRDLPDAQAARRHAIQIVAEHAGKPEMLGIDGSAIIVTVRNGGQRPVLIVRNVVSIEQPEP